MAGRLITFYSFKGGVGRSTVLATVAWILASCGKKVLLIDWDLDAPGLHHFFPEVDETDLLLSDGLLDLVVDFAALRAGETGRAATGEVADDDIGRIDVPEDGHGENTDPLAVNWAATEEGREAGLAAAIELALEDLVEMYVIQELGASFDLGDQRGEGYVHLMSAGRPDEEYTRKLVDFDWGVLFDRRTSVRRDPRSPFLERFREILCGTYDYVLVDSRTGMGELVSVSLLTLADQVVNCFGMSRQGVDGALRVTKRLRPDDDGRHTEENNGRPWKKTVFPVPTRLDASEGARLQAGRQDYQRGLNPVLKEQAADPGSGFHITDPATYWQDVEVPYSSFWALEEIPAPIAELDDGVVRSCENLVRYLTAGDPDPEGRLAGLQRPSDARIGELRGRAMRRRLPAFSHVLITYAVDDEHWADWLAQEARFLGFDVTLRPALDHLGAPGAGSGGDQRTGVGGADLLAEVSRKSGGLFCVVPILPARYSEEEVADALLVREARQLLTRDGDLVLRPMLVHDARIPGNAPESSGERLYNLAADVASEVVKEILGVPRVDTTRTDPGPGPERAIRYPGAEPEDPGRLAAQRLRYALRRQDLEEVVEQLLRRGELALDSRRLYDALPDFEAARDWVASAEADHGASTTAGDPKRARLRLLRARVLLGLGRFSMLTGDAATAHERRLEIMTLADPASPDGASEDDVWRVHVQALLFWAELVSPGSRTDRHPVGESLINAVRRRPRLDARLEAEARLALAKLRWSPDPAAARAVAAWEWQKNANQALRLFGELREPDGMARAELEIGLIGEELLDVSSKDSAATASILNSYKRAGLYMDEAGPEYFDIVLGHQILTHRGTYERDDDDAERAHLRALNLVRRREGADYIRQLVIESCFHLGRRPGRQNRSKRKRAEYYAQAVGQWPEEERIGPVWEYAEAFDEIRDLIYEGKFDARFLAESGFEVGPEAAARAAVRAAWSRMRLDAPDRPGEREKAAGIGVWLLSKPLPGKDELRRLVQVEVGRVGERGDADELLDLLGITKKAARRPGAQPSL
jgi:cellulose biosynthesis protein BcsQ